MVLLSGFYNFITAPLFLHIPNHFDYSGNHSADFKVLPNAVSFMSLRCCSSKCGFWSLCFYSKFLNQRKWISNSTVNENTLKLRILHGVYELPRTVSCLDTCSHGVTTVEGLYAYKIVISSMKNAWKKYHHKIESASLRNVSQWIPLIYVWIYHFRQAVPR